MSSRHEECRTGASAQRIDGNVGNDHASHVCQERLGALPPAIENGAVCRIQGTFKFKTERVSSIFLSIFFSSAQSMHCCMIPMYVLVLLAFQEIESSRHRKRSRHHSRLAAAHAAAVASSNSSSNNHNDTVVMNPHDLARRRSRSRREPAEFFHTSSSEMDIHAFFQPGRQPPVTTTTTTSIATTRTLTATATRHHPSAAAAQAEAEALPSATLTAAERMAQAYAERIFGHFAEASSSTGRVQTAHRSRSNRNSSSVTQQQPQQQQAQPHLQQQGQTMEDAICID